MKKKIYSAVLILAIAFAVTACSNASEPTSDSVTTLKFGFCPGPYGDLWKAAIAPQLEAKGYAFEYIEFSDYVQPNNALANGEIDVNLFQHTTYLENFTQAHGLELSAVTKVPTAGMGIWSENLTSLEAIFDGATVTIPNDETNQARGLRVLESAGLITLKEGIDASKAIPDDIDENPYHLVIIPTEAAQLPRTLDSADIAVISGNFAIGAGLDFSDAIYVEDLAEAYINVIAVRTEDLDAQFVSDIREAATSEAFKAVIEDTAGAFYTFTKPQGW